MSEFERPKVLVGRVEDVCLNFDAGVFDAVLCDPPYGLGFMDSAWDHQVPSPELWSKVLCVCKPGAWLMAFGGTRLHHRTVCGIEDGGWQVRDSLAWMYGTGFPKSYNISKGIDKAVGAEREVVGSGRSGQTRHAMAGDFAGAYDVTAPATTDAERWEGYGTALKPAYEPICLAQKPRDGTFVNNALTHGCGGLAIDSSRIPTDGPIVKTRSSSFGGAAYGGGNGQYTVSANDSGRWPANVILDEEAGSDLDVQSGESTSSTHVRKIKARPKQFTKGKEKAHQTTGQADSGGASRFFYCPKASRKEREAGLEGFETSIVNDGRATSMDNAYQRGDTQRRNTHPTVKPIDLIRYLARLILPPTREDGAPRRILVPFSGSGSEMIGCLLAGWDEVVGIEMSEEYAEISRARIEHWLDGYEHGQQGPPNG